LTDETHHGLNDKVLQCFCVDYSKTYLLLKYSWILLDVTKINI
jgi:hypothetical protein